VIDIVDTHQVYQHQWSKRRKFYVKNNYKIITSGINNYLDGEWVDDYLPLNKNEKIKQKTKPKSSCANNDSNIQRGKCLVLNI